MTAKVRRSIDFRWILSYEWRRGKNDNTSTRDLRRKNCGWDGVRCQGRPCWQNWCLFPLKNGGAVRWDQFSCGCDKTKPTFVKRYDWFLCEEASELKEVKKIWNNVSMWNGSFFVQMQFDKKKKKKNRQQLTSPKKNGIVVNRDMYSKWAPSITRKRVTGTLLSRHVDHCWPYNVRGRREIDSFIAIAKCLDDRKCTRPK